MADIVVVDNSNPASITVDAPGGVVAVAVDVGPVAAITVAQDSPTAVVVTILDEEQTAIVIDGGATPPISIDVIATSVVGADAPPATLEMAEPVFNVVTIGEVGPPGVGMQGQPGVTVVFDGNDGEDGMPIPGPRGATGDTGAQGISGLTVMGLDGEDGSDGMPIPGPRGATGNTGPQGAPGVTVVFDGADGEDGMPIPGPQGLQGIQGVQGAQGVQGYAVVFDGTDGEDGMPVPGPQGIQGVQGTQGVQGIQGVQGFAVALDGEDGSDGMPIPGAKGETGPTGSTGATGVQGPSIPGFDGADGDDGMPMPGMQGVQGVAGAQGGVLMLDGIDGEDGMPVPGPTGATGARGAQGAPVFMLDGTDGDDGMPVPGSQGIQGTPGLQGVPVFMLDGADGDDGMHIPGNQGAQGAQGIQGAQGVQGPPGVGLDGDSTDAGGIFAYPTLPLAVNQGGTGATTAANARTNLGAVNIAGDTMTGDLTIAHAGAVLLRVDSSNDNSALLLDKGASGKTAAINAYTNNTIRWQMNMGNTSAESGSNAGSDFTLLSFNDAGSTIATAFSIVRSTGLTTFSSGVVATYGTFGGTTINANAALTTTQYSTSGTIVFNNVLDTAPAGFSNILSSQHDPGVSAKWNFQCGSTNFAFKNDGHATCVAWDSTSDERMKEEFGDITVLDKIDDLWVGTFQWKPEYRTTAMQPSLPVRHIGVKAGNLKALWPELVSYSNDDPSFPDKMVANYGAAAAVALKGVMELKARIVAQDKIITSLLSRLDALEGARA